MHRVREGTYWEEPVLEEGGRETDCMCREGSGGLPWSIWEPFPGLQHFSCPIVKMLAAPPGQGEARILRWMWSDDMGHSHALVSLLPVWAQRTQCACPSRTQSCPDRSPLPLLGKVSKAAHSARPTFQDFTPIPWNWSTAHPPLSPRACKA